MSYNLLSSHLNTVVSNFFTHDNDANAGFTHSDDVSTCCDDVSAHSDDVAAHNDDTCDGFLYPE